MSLSVALEQARSSLANQTARTQVVTSNISNAYTQGYHRRTQQVSSGDVTGTQQVTLRATNAALEQEMLKAVSRSGETGAQADVLGQLSVLLAEPGALEGLPARISVLNSSLMQFTAEPSNDALGHAVLSSAEDIAASIRASASQIVVARAEINERITRSAKDVERLLKDLSSAETQFQISSSTGGSANDIVDRRENILTRLADIVAIRVVARPDNSLSVYTDSGIALYDRVPREIGVSTRYDPEVGDNVVDLTIDGMNATASNSIMPIKSGALAGLAEARDRILRPASIQLDEMTRVLVEAFADSDSRTPPTLPRMQGLFVIEGSSGEIPSEFTARLSSRLKINDLATGNANAIAILREGGFVDPSNSAYNHNPNGWPGFQAHLASLKSALDAQVEFHPAGGIGTHMTLNSYAAGTSASINQIWQENESNRQTAETSRVYLQKKMSDELGVNLDDETALMLDIQHSYQVTAKLISSLDDMFKDLLNRLN